MDTEAKGTGSEARRLVGCTVSVAGPLVQVGDRIRVERVYPQAGEVAGYYTVASVNPARREAEEGATA